MFFSTLTPHTTDGTVRKLIKITGLTSRGYVTNFTSAAFIVCAVSVGSPMVMITLVSIICDPEVSHRTGVSTMTTSFTPVANATPPNRVRPECPIRVRSWRLACVRGLGRRCFQA